jgi:hypothetical protein
VCAAPIPQPHCRGSSFRNCCSCDIAATIEFQTDYRTTSRTFLTLSFQEILFSMVVYPKSHRTIQSPTEVPRTFQILGIVSGIRLGPEMDRWQNYCTRAAIAALQRRLRSHLMHSTSQAEWAACLAVGGRSRTGRLFPKPRHSLKNGRHRFALSPIRGGDVLGCGMDLLQNRIFTQRQLLELQPRPRRPHR